MNDEQLISKCTSLVRREGKASTTFLRAELKLGYGRANRIIGELEKRGVVSAADKLGNRKIIPEVKLNCEENGAVLHREAMSAELFKINQVFEKFDAAAKSISSGTIQSANLAREIGLHLQTLCGHEQMKLSFWQTHCEKALRFKFESAKLFISVANKMTEPAKTLNDAVPFVQTILQADGILLLPERTETQQRATISVFQKVLAEITMIRVGYKKALKERPMEQWEANALDSFLSETGWIAEERDRAAKLRHQKFRE